MALRSLPRLVVSVDTEEEGLWGGRYPTVGNTTENLRALPGFQELCNRFGIRPTYLIDAPVLDDSAAVDRLAAWQELGDCEVGAHCHPWCNPPFEETVTPRETYLCNLPEDLQRRKLAWLTETIRDRIGRPPTSFRAGRYGLDALGAKILADLNYKVDSSVIPFMDYTLTGGPNFEDAPLDPYWIGDDLCKPAASGDVLEVPVTVGYSRRNFASAHSMRLRASRHPWRRLRAVGLLDRTGLSRRIKLSPEQATANSLERLVDVLLARKAKSLVLMFHSSSLLAGGSPYVPDDAALQRFYSRLEKFFQLCRSKWRFESATLSEIVAPLSPAPVVAGPIAVTS